MEINNKHIPDSSKSGKSELPKFLAKYESSDFSIQQRARFLYYLCISIVGSLVFMTIYTSYIQLISPNYSGLYLPVILPELAIILIVLVCLFLIIKGFSELATHLLLISSITTLWVVMWFDKGDAIARLDSIVFILAYLACFLYL